MKLFQTQFRKKVKGQTLYICEDDIASGLEKAKVEQVLKQKVEILSKSQLEEAFYASKEGNCFLHVEPDQSKMWVLQMIDGKVLYVSRPVSKGKLTQKDFKDLSKKIR
jgi:plasmid maintenance system killer protein